MTRRALDYAVLGLVAERPAHGYALWQELETTLGELFDLAPGRIYEVLARLERDGLVSGHLESSGRRCRRVFFVRPAGRRALSSWAATELSPLAPLGDLALLVVAARQDPAALDSIAHAWCRHAHRLAELLSSVSAGRPVVAGRSVGSRP